MRNSRLCLAGLIFLASAAVLFQARTALSWQQQNPAQPAAPSTSQTPPPPPSPAPAPSGPTIVLDPAHGGTDTGARGENGVSEKDIVLEIARTVREQLTQRGYRVVMTRNDDSNPSYDDRAALANSFHDAIFISIHVSSTGTPATARAYYDQFSIPIPVQAAGDPPGAKTPVAQPSGFASWPEAQRPYVETSHRLADLIQNQLSQSLTGSPPVSRAAAVRALRSVTAPAVAVELSSVSSSTPAALAGSALAIGNAISNGISAFRQAGGSK